MEYEYDYDLSPAHPYTNEKTGGAVGSVLPSSIVVNPLAPPTQSFNAMDNIVWQNGNPYQPKLSDERSKTLMKEINASKQPTGNRSFRDVLESVRNTNKENIRKRQDPIRFSPPSPEEPPSVSNALDKLSQGFNGTLQKKVKPVSKQWISPTESPKESAFSKMKPRRLDVLNQEPQVPPSNAVSLRNTANEVDLRASPSNAVSVRNSANQVARRASPSNQVDLRASPSNAVSLRNTANQIDLRASPSNAVSVRNTANQVARRASPSNQVDLRASPSNAVSVRNSANQVDLRASPSNAVSVRNTANQVARRASPSNQVDLRASPSNAVSVRNSANQVARRASPSKRSVELGAATLGTGDLAAALARRKGQSQLPPVPPTLPTGIRRLPRNQDYGIFPSLPLKSSSKVNKNTFSLNLL